MKPAQRLILFLHSFSGGVLMPILSLLLLERGCDLRTLPLVLGVYSATVILCEVPTGVCADLLGRKKTFLISCALGVGSMLALLLSGSVWGLLPGFVLYGLSRAFSSGSLDALIIEEYAAAHGGEGYAAITGQLSLCQSVGLAAGAVAGGALPNWRGYGLHLMIRLVLAAAVGLLCLAFVRETRREPAGPRPTLRGYLCEAAGIVKGARAMAGLLVCLLSTGALISLVEAYWQPMFTAIITPEQTPLLGLVSAVGFASAALGNVLIRRAKAAAGAAEWRRYAVLRIILAASAALFALQANVPGFFVFYGLLYLLLGGADVLEQTLMNRMVPDAQRAGLLSVASLSCQLGGLLACGVAGAAVGTLGFAGLCLTAGAAVLLCTASALFLRKPRKSVTN